MATLTVPASGLSLTGPHATGLDSGTSRNGRKDATRARSAIVLNLNAHISRELKQCAEGGIKIQLLGGTTPRIQYGEHTLDLNVRPEKFRHELYSKDSSSNSSDQFAFSGLVSHHALVKAAAGRKHEEDPASADAALVALKQSLASMAKDKEARKVTISNSVVTAAKHGRSLNPHRHPSSLLSRTQHSSSSNGTPMLGPAPTSAGPSDAQIKAREKAMRTALVHLLAVEPLSEDEITLRTRIPKSQISTTLGKIATKSGPKWELSNKSFKLLDPWDFKYPEERQRKDAIENAVRAFDRQRIPKDDKAWQTLLREEERGKGIVLSRLQIGGERKEQAYAGTPGLAPSPLPEQERSGATPKPGTSSTPRIGATATGRSAANFSIEKRLKEAKKKDAQEKKKKEKEAAAAAAAHIGTPASDREGGRPKPASSRRIPAKKPPAGKIKSEEVVHSSDEDEDGEIRQDARPTKKPEATRQQAASLKTKVDRDASRPESSVKPRGSDSVRKTEGSWGQIVAEKAAEASKPSKSSNPSGAQDKTRVKDAGPSNKPTYAKDSAKVTASNKMASQRQASPREASTKPKVPSPLGTAEPRNASDLPGTAGKTATTKKTVSGSATGVNATTKATGTPKQDGLNFFGDNARAGRGPVIKKRPLESSDESKEPPRKTIKPNPATSVKNSSSNRIASPSSNNTPSTRTGNSDNHLKRKANDLSSDLHDHAAAAARKHRRTESSSTHSQAATNSSAASLTTAPTVSPIASTPARSPASEDVMSTILDEDADDTDSHNHRHGNGRAKLTFEQAIEQAERFMKQLYPAYEEMYAKLKRKPANQIAGDEMSRFLKMHRRMQELKRDIAAAV